MAVYNENEKMKKILLRLKIEFALVVFLGGLMVALYESGVWEEGALMLDGTWGYLTQSACILLTLCCIPMALKLLNFKAVRMRLARGEETASWQSYCRWSEIRLALLAAPLYINLALYYATMDTIGAYCALILVNALIFCWPSADKAEAELTGTE